MVIHKSGASLSTPSNKALITPVHKPNQILRSINVQKCMAGAMSSNYYPNSKNKPTTQEVAPDLKQEQHATCTTRLKTTTNITAMDTMDQKVVVSYNTNLLAYAYKACPVERDKLNPEMGRQIHHRSGVLGQYHGRGP